MGNLEIIFLFRVELERALEAELTSAFLKAKCGNPQILRKFD